MMKFRLIFIFSLVYVCFSGYASPNVEEEVFVKLNASTFLSGESILYTAFVNSKVTGKPSPLSKILYIELLNDEGKVVHQAKLKVENGRTFGDIFISSTLSTGTYRLIAYTRWMKNFDSYFEVPVVIINPFKTVATQSSHDSEWDMTFKTGSKGIIVGLDNTLSYSMTFPDGKPTPFKGKVVDAEGNKLLEFFNTDKTYGKLRFKPVSLSKHRVILEDEAGQFYFFDLPDIFDSGTLLSQIAFDDFTVFSIQSKRQFDNIQLLVSNKKGYEFQQAVRVGGSIKFLHKGLEPGLYSAKIIQDNTLLDRLAFYISGNVDNKLTLNQTTFDKRELVSINQSLPKGSYAISVRRVRDGFVDYRSSAASYSQLLSQIKTSAGLPFDSFDMIGVDEEDLNLLLIGQQLHIPSTGDSIRFLPEHRGELISGQVTNRSKVGLNDKFVSLSVLNKNQYAVAKTDGDGRFVINNYSTNEDVRSYIKVHDSADYEIVLDENFRTTHREFNAPELRIDSVMISNLVESSVRTQVENAYFDIKKDSSYHSVSVNPLFEELQFDFVLDDYNRFRTIKETITEYIPALAVRKDKRDPVVKVRIGELFADTYDPLIMLDGIPVSSAEILSFSPFKVKRISGLSSRVYIGNQLFDGLVMFETFEGDLHGLELNTDYQPYDLKGIEPKKIYQFPNYSSDALDRIPDQREQLYWEPLLKSSGESFNVQFYTSDVVGDYVIEIDGFTAEGVPVYRKGEMSVR